MLAFPCPQCGILLQVHEQWAGKKVQCGGCRHVIEVPPSAQAVPALSPRATVERPSPPVLSPLAGAATGGAESPFSGGNDSLEETREAESELDAFLGPAQAAGELGRLGGYRVLGVLGRGGTGLVLEAEDVQLRRPVALKVLLPALASSAAARERFLRGARAAATIDHDHVVTIYQVGEDRGLPFLAMERLQGETLATRLRHGKKLPVADVLRVGRETAEGLAAAHACGVIHRDIKPANIWLEGDRGRVKILDFGLARVASEDFRLTRPGTMLGTPAYMAPEQTRGGEADPRSDLFSLGCVLYRACTGELPFQGKDVLTMLAALATETPRPVRERSPEIPASLAALVTRLLAKDPAARPPSARAVAEALTAIETGRSGENSGASAGGPGGAEPLTALPAARVGALTADGVVRPRQAALPRPPAACVVLGLAGVLLLAVLTLVASGALFLAWNAVGPRGRASARDEADSGLFARGPRVYLADLPEFDVKAGPWPFVKNGTIGDGDGKPIQVNGVLSPKGLGMHPPDLGDAAAKYRLGKQAAVFKAGAALNDTGGSPWGHAVFEVLGDGKSLWQSAPVSEARRLQEVTVDVTGVDVLELRVHAPGSHFGLHAVWVEPRVLRTAKTPDR